MEGKLSKQMVPPTNNDDDDEVVDDYSLSYIVHLGRQYCSMVNKSTTTPTEGTTHQNMPIHHSSPQPQIGSSTMNFNYMNNPQASLPRDQDFKGAKEHHGKSTSLSHGQQNPSFQSNPPLISFGNGYLQITNMGMDQNPCPMMPCNSQNNPSLINELASLRSSGLNLKGNKSDGYKRDGLIVEKDLVIMQKHEESCGGSGGGGVCALKNVDEDDFDFINLEDFFMSKDRFGFDV